MNGKKSQKLYPNCLTLYDRGLGSRNIFFKKLIILKKVSRGQQKYEQFIPRMQKAENWLSAAVIRTCKKSRVTFFMMCFTKGKKNCVSKKNSKN